MICGDYVATFGARELNNNTIPRGVPRGPAKALRAHRAHGSPRADSDGKQNEKSEKSIEVEVSNPVGSAHVHPGLSWLPIDSMSEEVLEAELTGSYLASSLVVECGGIAKSECRGSQHQDPPSKGHAGKRAGTQHEGTQRYTTDPDPDSRPDKGKSTTQRNEKTKIKKLSFRRKLI